MTKDQFYKFAATLAPTARLQRDGSPLPESKQVHLNRLVSSVRALRAVYVSDPLIREVCTNILADAILVDGE